MTLFNTAEGYMKRLILISAAVLLVFVPARLTAKGPGTTGAQFLKIDGSARPIAMGGAYSAVKPDAGSIFYNPALAVSAPQRTVSGSYLSYFQSVNYGSLGGVVPFGEGSVGVGVSYLGVSDIPRRGVDDIDDPEGTSDPEGNFGASDIMIAGSKAWRDPFPSLLENLDLGVSLKLVYLTLDDKSAFSAMADLGAYYPVSDILSVGMSVQNIGMPVKFDRESDPLPLGIRSGAAYKAYEGLTVALDLNHYILEGVTYASLGSEYWISEAFALRAGYKYGYESDVLGAQAGLGAGIGFNTDTMGLDYAFAPMGELGNTHRVTLSAGF